MTDPKHLGKNWAGFDFAKALGKPVRIINDAALQALGSYRGGPNAFSRARDGAGFGARLEQYVLPLELGDLPYRDRSIIEDYLGKPGAAGWRKELAAEVAFAVAQLKKSLIADYVVLGGGNVKKLDHLPDGAERGYNRNAFLGGVRLWQINNRTAGKWMIM